VAVQAVEEGVARSSPSWDEVYQAAKRDITQAREISHALVRDGFIRRVPETMLAEALAAAVAAARA